MGRRSNDVAGGRGGVRDRCRSDGGRGFLTAGRAARPTVDPIGIVPQTMNRIVAFMRPCIRSGVMACRRLTWLMLYTTFTPPLIKVATTSNGTALSFDAMPIRRFGGPNRRAVPTIVQ